MNMQARWSRELALRAPGVAFATVLAAIAYGVAMVPGVRVMGPLTVALLIGIAARALVGMPASLVEGTRFSARSVLRAGIVLMGARLDFGLVGRVGPRVLVLDLAIIAAGIAGIAWIARRFGVPRQLATLLAVGTSVCGASAVVAAGSVTKSKEDDVTLAVALCGVLGTVGVLFYVLAGPLLTLSVSQLAVMSGSTLHEVAQVMAAAFTWGSVSGDLGTIVKLTRVVLLAPALIVLGVVSREKNGGRLRWSWRDPPVPWFVVGFLAVGIASSVGLVPAPAKALLSTASVFLMVVAMAAMGLGTQLEMIRRAGWKVVYAGLAGFAALAVLSFALIHLLRIQ